MHLVSGRLFYFYHHYYFHSITTVSTPPEPQATEDLVQEGVTGTGGGRGRVGCGECEGGAADNAVFSAKSVNCHVQGIP